MDDGGVLDALRFVGAVFGAWFGIGGALVGMFMVKRAISRRCNERE